MILKNLKWLRKIHCLTGAQFYKLTTDYLLGLDNTVQHSSVEIISNRYSLSAIEKKKT